MTEFVTDKTVITKKILGIIDPEHTSDDLHNAKMRWWSNLLPGGGFGLTWEGAEAFKQAGIAEYKIFGKHLGLNLDIIPMNIIRLRADRRLPCPYFAGPHLSWTIYDSRVAMMIELHGSLLSYLNALEDRKENLLENCND